MAGGDVVERDFRDFVVSRSPSLVHTAYLLTGDHHIAHDLVQTALSRTWPHWERVSAGHPDAYVRQVMVRLQASWWRRKWRGEVPTEHLPEAAAFEDPSVVEREVLARALANLATRQRQAVVLRYVEDLPVEQVAALMGCSTGTIKSHCARGLARLREVLEPQRAEDRS